VTTSISPDLTTAHHRKPAAGGRRRYYHHRTQNGATDYITLTPELIHCLSNNKLMSTTSSTSSTPSYSLRLRLLSAVDLPPSLSPSVPLCPWFELGLVDTSAHDDDTDGEDRAKKELHPKWETDERQRRESTRENEACALLRRLKSDMVRTSAFKIMTKVSLF
jgi:hypothetical protein